MLVPLLLYEKWNKEMTDVGDDELAVIGTMCQPLRRMPRGDKTAAVGIMCHLSRHSYIRRQNYLPFLKIKLLRITESLRNTFLYIYWSEIFILNLFVLSVTISMFPSLTRYLNLKTLKVCDSALQKIYQRLLKSKKHRQMPMLFFMHISLYFKQYFIGIDFIIIKILKKYYAKSWHL